MTVRVGGVDLSLTGLALVAVPSDWGCDPRRVLRVTFGTDPKYGSVTRRMRDMARDAAAWLEWARVTHVYLEKPNVSRKQHNLDQAFRLGGMVELAVFELMGISCEWAPLFVARTLFCGSTRKDVAQSALDDVLDDEHQRDALVVANFALHELGYPCLSARAA